MDLSLNQEPNERTSKDLQSIRTSNLGAAKVLPNMLEQLRHALAADSTDLPELAMVEIPEIRIAEATEFEESNTAPAMPEDQAGLKIHADLSLEGGDGSIVQPDPMRRRESNDEPAATGSKQSAAKSVSQESAKNTTDKKPGTAKSRRKSATADKGSDIAWFHSLTDLLHDQAIVELCRRITGQFGKEAHAALQFVSADEELSTNRTTARIAQCICEQLGARVLLVDANWEANLQSNRTSEPAVKGLAEVLKENVEWQSLVIPTENDNLCVLPCGTCEVPNRRLDSASLMKLAAEWQQAYDYVCVNSGQVNQLITRRLAMCSNGVYILVGLNLTTKSDAQNAARVLAECRARVMGSIVFDSPTSA